MDTPSLPFPAVVYGLAERVRWPTLPAIPRDAMVTLVPCLLSAAAAVLLGSFDWCHGGVRATLALCLGAAGASGTLLLRWELYPETMRRSAACAALGGLGAAAPLLGFV